MLGILIFCFAYQAYYFILIYWKKWEPWKRLQKALGKDKEDVYKIGTSNDVGNCQELHEINQLSEKSCKSGSLKKIETSKQEGSFLNEQMKKGIVANLSFGQTLTKVSSDIKDNIEMSNQDIFGEAMHKFAILVAARNEESVIGQLLESIHLQEYPADFIDTYIVADNCDDDTAEVARENGAIVYERFNKIEVGKGYALKYLLDQMKEEGKDKDYDGYFIFDADNLLEKDYVKEMDRTFRQGYRIITSYRNTKNFGSNWLTSGYGLWFLHEAQWLNKARMFHGTSCAVSGTGFFFSREILERMGGWHYFLLTEDIEFTISQILQGETIGYCEKAVFYDEQPENFVASWHQRARWVKGYQQVFSKYGHRIWDGITRERRFACFDMTMSIWPAFVLMIASVFINIGLVAVGLATDRDLSFVWYNVGMNLLKTYAAMMGLGIYTLISEWKMIHASTAKKLMSIVTFPIFMYTFAPIAVVALSRKVEWKPIKHSCTVRMSQLSSQVKS